MQNIDFIPDFKKKDIQDFYHKWYRPSMQSLVIVGDIDPNEMEKKNCSLHLTPPICIVFNGGKGFV